MTIDECIDALQRVKNKYPNEGGDVGVVVGVGFGDGGEIECASLQAEPSEGENEVVFEEDFLGEQPETRLARKIKSVLRRYFETDPWTGEPNAEFDDAYTAQEAVDAIADLLK